MKKFFLAICFLGSQWAFAGDSYINCYEKGAEEDEFIASSSPMGHGGEDWKLAIAFNYANPEAAHISDQIVVTALRGPKTNGKWIIRTTIIDNWNGGFTENVIELDEVYYVPFSVGEKLSCVVSD